VGKTADVKWLEVFRQ